VATLRRAARKRGGPLPSIDVATVDFPHEIHTQGLTGLDSRENRERRQGPASAAPTRQCCAVTTDAMATTSAPASSAGISAPSAPGVTCGGWSSCHLRGRLCQLCHLCVSVFGASLPLADRPCGRRGRRLHSFRYEHGAELIGGQSRNRWRCRACGLPHPADLARRGAGASRSNSGKPGMRVCIVAACRRMTIAGFTAKDHSWALARWATETVTTRRFAQALGPSANHGNTGRGA
jgi:hypothetical protein